MTNKSLPILLYAMKWLVWFVQYTFVWPAATLMLLLIMGLRMDNITPGKMMADEIAVVTYNARSGEYRIPFCRDEAPDSHPPKVTPDINRYVCRDSVITDAKGYAAHIDSSLRFIPALWVVMAAMFAAMSWLLGSRPHLRRYEEAGGRSALFRYSPINDPESVRSSVKPSSLNKDGDHE